MRACLLGGLGLSCVVIASACGGAGARTTPPGADGGTPPVDSGPGHDAGPADASGRIDPGPPPGCSIMRSATRVADRPTLERNEDPAFFGPLDESRDRFVFLGKAADENRLVSIRSVVVDRETSEGEITTVAELEDGEDVPRFTAAFGSEGVLAMWQRSRGTFEMLDEYETRIERLAFDARGEPIAAPGATWRDGAASPIVSAAIDGYAVLYAELLEAGGTVAVRPRLQRVAADGEALGPDAPLTGFVPVEASSISIRPLLDGLVTVYLLAPSAYVLPMTADGTPDDAARVFRGLANLDDVATSGDAIALVWTVPRGDGGSVFVAVVDRRASVRSQIELERFSGEAPPRVAVAAAWPGFAVVWRRGGVNASVFRGAGIGQDGLVIVPPHELVAAPDATGRVFLDADGRDLTIGYRYAPMEGGYGYGMARVCLRTE